MVLVDYLFLVYGGVGRYFLGFYGNYFFIEELYWLSCNYELFRLI